MIPLQSFNMLLFSLWTLALFMLLPDQLAAQQNTGHVGLLPQLNINMPLPQLSFPTTRNSPSASATPASWQTAPTAASRNSFQNSFSSSGGQTSSPVATAPEYSQQDVRERYRRISQGAQQFGLELLSKFSDVLQARGARRDFMISPFAIWSLLLLLTEAAAGNTQLQLRRALHISDEDQIALRRAYREVSTYLKVNTSTIEVASMQALFTDIHQPVKRDFELLIERDYGSNLIPVDFHNPVDTADHINSEVRKLTRGFIEYSVLPQDLKDATLFMLSALYFKGQWKRPFNRSMTRPETFYDEDGRPAGEVDMMMQEANFNYTRMNELDAHVLELPYGKEDRLSMLIILPRSGVSLNKVVHNLQNVGIAAILQRLTESSYGYEDEVVEVSMPRFTTSSDLSLTSVLEEMGILDIFQPAEANLSKMSANAFVQQVIHVTKIIVNEEGTEAAGVASAVLINKTTPPKFNLNRPFLYLILEKNTNVLLFVGQVTNPNNIPY